MIKYYFGSPGSGKTTYAVYSALKSKNEYRHCVCNFENTVPGVKYDNMNGGVSKDFDYKDYSGLGTYRYPDSTLVVIDEAGIQYNNRMYKKFTPALIAYFKYHRHFKNDLYVFSQSWEDVDIVIRRLTDELWYIKKIGPFTMARKVRKFVTVNESDYQIIDGYKFENPFWTFLPIFGRKTIEFIYRPKYYKYFDSYNDPFNLPIKDLSSAKEQ